MKENMQEALKYFRDLGFPIHNGLIDSILNEEQINKLLKWKDETSKNGIMMPNEEDFYRSVLLAISLHPQKTLDGKIQYLFGKGIGVEIALRGTIKGRNQHNIEVPYRSHSDFELYDNSVENYNDSFKQIYGNQEWYPPTKTKALNDIPEGYMDSTCEKVIIDGYEVLVPQLELLFLDKFLRKEATPREDIYDCEWLAHKYELDLDLIKSYLESYYFSYESEAKQEQKKSYKSRFIQSIIRNIQGKYEEYAEQGIDIQNILNMINEEVEATRKISEKSYYNGISSSMFIPLQVQDIMQDENRDFTLTNGYIEKTIELIESVTQNRIDTTRDTTLSELDKLFERVEQEREKLDINDYAGIAYDENTIGTLEKALRAFAEQERANAEEVKGLDE